MFGAKGIETGLAPTPVGPSGKRSSMYNGLADSIWVGSKNKPAAAKWVEFLGSADCQNIVGEKAVVFPADSSPRPTRPRPRSRPRASTSPPSSSSEGQDDVPVPDHRPRLTDRRHHASGHGRRPVRQGASRHH